MLSLEERYSLWQQLLSSSEWVSYDDVMNALAAADNDKVPFEFYDVVRKDRENLSKLLKSSGYSMLVQKIGKKTHLAVEPKDFNLLELQANQKVAQPYIAILDMLSKSKGLLPEEFLNSLSEKYQKMSENVNVTKSISFDADYDYMSELGVFPDVYKALNKSAIWVSFHPVNKPEDYVDGYFYPEYLKQYRSSWYAFGMFVEEGKDPVFQKIPLNNIDDYNDVDEKSYPFIKSPIEDYEEYFDDIIGVENPDRNEVETIKFRISNRMFQRLRDKPMHPSQMTCKELDSKGFHGMQINVKYNIELMRTIMNLGSDIEIVEPVHIRKRVIKDLKKSLKMYGE